MLKAELEKEYKRLQRENKKLLKQLEGSQESVKEKFLDGYDQYDRPIVARVYDESIPRFHRLVDIEARKPVRENRKAVIRRMKDFLGKRGFNFYEVKKRFAGELQKYGYTFDSPPGVSSDNFPAMDEALKDFDNQIYVDQEKKIAEDKANKSAQANIARKKMLKEKHGDKWQRYW